MEIEPYIGALEQRYAISIARFRCRSNNMPMTKFLRENRGIAVNDLELPHCSLCNSGIADEFHYLLVCPRFVNERRVYLKRHVYISPNVLKFRGAFRS